MDGIDEPLTIDPMPLSDLSSLLGGEIVQSQTFTKGVVTAWDPAIRRGTVTISGTVFTDLSVLDTSALATLVAGDIVLILKLNQSWLIVGRILDPL
jgi:hypothetical protein